MSGSWTCFTGGRSARADPSASCRGPNGSKPALCRAFGVGDQHPVPLATRKRTGARKPARGRCLRGVPRGVANTGFRVKTARRSAPTADVPAPWRASHRRVGACRHVPARSGLNRRGGRLGRPSAPDSAHARSPHRARGASRACPGWAVRGESAATRCRRRQARDHRHTGSCCR